MSPPGRATATIPTRRHGHVVHESWQFRADVRAPAVGKIEYKRGTDAGVIDQGLYYMSWLMAHKDVAELAEVVDEVLLGLGDGVSRVQRKQYRAYQRLRNFACVCQPQKTKLLVYLKADPREVDLIPGFTRDVTEVGHHGTGDLEVQLRSEWDVERAVDLFRASYAAA